MSTADDIDKQTVISPFNGKWMLEYSSNLENYMDAYEMNEESREILRKISETDAAANRLYVEYSVDDVAGTLSKKVTYDNKSLIDDLTDVKFESFHTATFYDGKPVKYIFGREGGNNNMIVRFEIGNNDKVHAMVFTEVYGNMMLSTYSCRRQTYLQKFKRKEAE